MATIRSTSSSSTKKCAAGGLEPLSPEVPTFTAADSVTVGAQGKDSNLITYVDDDDSRSTALDDRHDKGMVAIGDSAAATTELRAHSDDDVVDDVDDDDEGTSLSSEAEEDLPQSKADILHAAGVSISLEELQVLQADEAPLELITEFLRCVMSQEYYAAKILCEYILRFEPDNATAREFYPTIMERIRLDEQMETESSSSSSSASSISSSSSDAPDDDNSDHNQPLPKKPSHSCHTHSTTQAASLH